MSAPVILPEHTLKLMLLRQGKTSANVSLTNPRLDLSFLCFQHANRLARNAHQVPNALHVLKTRSYPSSMSMCARQLVLTGPLRLTKTSAMVRKKSESRRPGCPSVSYFIDCANNCLTCDNSSLCTSCSGSNVLLPMSTDGSL